MSVSTPEHDIEDRDDIERLVRAFYSRALHDPLIGYLFVDEAKLDLEAHVPVISAFWATILLGEQSYSGGAFAVHADLHAQSPLQRGHFDRWLHLWNATVDELFAGPRADAAKAHAQRVARAFHRRLQGLSWEPDDAGAGMSMPLQVTWHGAREG